MMRLRHVGAILLGAGFVLYLSSARAQADSDLAPTDRYALERVIDDSAETIRSGHKVPWGNSTLGGTVVLDRAYSLSNSEICNACSDPCRRVRYTVVTGDSLTEYEGTRCRQAANEPGTVPQWTALGSDRQIRRLASVTEPSAPPPQPEALVLPPKIPAPANEPTPPTVAIPQSQDTAPTQPARRSPSLKDIAAAQRRELVKHAQRVLSDLLYFHGALSGQEDDATHIALREFLNDERSTLATSLSADVLILLENAKARSSGRRNCANTPLAQGRNYVGCGRFHASSD